MTARYLINTNGAYLSLHNRPLPPLEAYEAFVSTMPRHNRTAVNAAKLRRAVTMRREGATTREVADHIGIAPETVRKWFGVMPGELVGVN